MIKLEPLKNSAEQIQPVSIINGVVQIEFGRRWARRGHDTNMSWLSPAKDWAYINIPKNSSTSVKNSLTHNGWEVFWLRSDVEDDLFIDESKLKYLVLLRDPVSRWISGISEYLTMYHSDAIDELCCEEGLNETPLYGQRLAIDIIFNQFCFDDHTDTQISYLHGIDLSSCHFIFIDDNLEKNLNKFLRSANLDTVKVKKENVAHGRNRNMQKFIYDILKHSPNRRERLHEYLWGDINLLSKVFEDQ
jgi:hypothetical protein